jgi:hypothetical protein
MRHADWTDGTGPVGGHPLSTDGRKIDTRKDLGYTTQHWVDLANRHRLWWWDGHIPDYANLIKAEAEGLANIATYRLTCRLIDMLKLDTEPQPVNEQGYPVVLMRKWQASRGYMATGKYGPKGHDLIFG